MFASILRSFVFPRAHPTAIHAKHLHESYEELLLYRQRYLFLAYGFLRELSHFRVSNGVLHDAQSNFAPQFSSMLGVPFSTRKLFIRLPVDSSCAQMTATSAKVANPFLLPLSIHISFNDGIVFIPLYRSRLQYSVESEATDFSIRCMAGVSFCFLLFRTTKIN